MSEYASGYNNPPQEEFEQPALPDMELIDFIQNMSSQERLEYKRKLLAGISDRESLVHLINNVQEATGHPVDIIY